MATGAFPETQRLAEEAIRYQRDPTGVVGSGTDPLTAWTFPEIIAATEARLRVLGTQMERLSQAGTAMTAALWPDSVHPCSFSRLARWLEMGPDRPSDWRVIRPFCIMLLYRYLLHYGLLFHVMSQYLWLFSLILQGLHEEGECRQLEFWAGKGANITDLFCTTPKVLKLHGSQFWNI